jgi:sucrose phosphorylase
MSLEERMRQLVQFLYPEHAGIVFDRLQALLKHYIQHHPDLSEEAGRRQLTEQDAVLITYGDQFQTPYSPPLHSLKRFLDNHLKGCINGVHILPFFPYSSDDGFSVIDYRAVNPTLGSWDDILSLRHSFHLMFDVVINHISRESEWFQRFLAGDPKYQDYFIVTSPQKDLTQVVRPRTLPLLTPVKTAQGQVSVWTTFSADQIDLNYENPEVLLEMVELILFYAAKGASLIRLDAIAYLWKIPGTPCIHLPQTHAVVKLFRAVLDAAAPGVLLITETNVPHAENISYFGEPLPGANGTDEAQMVYAFPLAPLVLHTFHSGSTRALSNWIASLSPLLAEAAYFNFLASHDGIGVRPAEGLLTVEEIQGLVEKTLDHGGKVSYKTNSGGTQSAYELNTTWYGALNDPNHPDPEIDIRRFIASQSVMLILAGVPGIYAHSLFGSRSCRECFEETGRARSLNREKLQLPWLEERLADSESHQSRVFSAYWRMLQVRSEQKAFHPQGAQRVLPVEEGVLAVLRTSPDQSECILCLVEAAGHPITVQVDLEEQQIPGGAWDELLTGKTIDSTNGRLEVDLHPYACAWLKPKRVEVK